MKNCLITLVVASVLTIAVITSKKAQAQNSTPQRPDHSVTMIADAGEANTNKTESSTVFLTEIPEGYRDWKLIAVSRLTAAKGSQLRGMLANDLAIQAYRNGKLPFPDGAIVAAIHWNEVPSEDNNNVLAKGFP